MGGFFLPRVHRVKRREHGFNRVRMGHLLLQHRLPAPQKILCILGGIACIHKLLPNFFDSYKGVLH
jgi:hypothetical protein